MRRKISLLLIFLLLLFVTVLNAQQFSVKNIPAELMEKANVVKRTEKVYFEIVDPSHTILKRQYALTIFNEQGAEFSDFLVFYSKLSSLKSFSGTLYDADGKEIQKIKWKDLKDESAVSGNLMDDFRVKKYELYHRNYPYTIMYEYEEHNNNTLFFENWQPVGGEKFAVQSSKFTISFPKGLKIRYKTFNYNGNPKVLEEENKELFIWEVSDIKALKNEPYSKYFYELTPTVLTGPTDFEIEGYKGNMSTWKDFGQFVYRLTKDRQMLPQNVKNEVQFLTSNTTDDLNKISILYKYLQKNTRYISIQLGLGGWQPFDANYVAKNAYGDCKALVNYMVSLLKEAGIKSYYTLVKAGDDKKRLVIDMPSQQFNHVILCVPVKQDTIWLECTSQTLPMGYLSSFTADRYALLIDEEGGKLVRTPKYSMEDNMQFRQISGKIDEEGKLKATISTKYAGLQQEDLHDMISYLGKDKIKERLNQSLPLSSYNVSKFNYMPIDEKIPKIVEDLEVEVNNYGRITGKRLIIEPNIISKRQARQIFEDRIHPIVLNSSYVDVDSAQVHIPIGYSLETMPKEVNLHNKFGDYIYKTTIEGNCIRYYRLFKQCEGEYPAADYKELIDFYNAVYTADRGQVVLIKNE